MSAPAPKMGPTSDDEYAAIEKWRVVHYEDLSLARSIGERPHGERPAAYILVRALRAGVPLEKLL